MSNYTVVVTYEGCEEPYIAHVKCPRNDAVWFGECEAMAEWGFTLKEFEDEGGRAIAVFADWKDNLIIC